MILKGERVGLPKRIESEIFQHLDHVIDARRGISCFRNRDRHIVGTDGFDDINLANIEVGATLSNFFVQGFLGWPDIPFSVETWTLETRNAE